jgi:hypothetical protein
MLHLIKVSILERGKSGNYKMRPISDYGYWVGASDIEQQPGQFYWTDGTKVDDDWWHRDYPKSYGQGKKTGVFLFAANLADSEFLDTELFVCEMGENFSKCP